MILYSKDAVTSPFIQMKNWDIEKSLWQTKEKASMLRLEPVHLTIIASCLDAFFLIKKLSVKRNTHLLISSLAHEVLLTEIHFYHCSVQK